MTRHKKQFMETVKLYCFYPGPPCDSLSNKWISTFLGILEAQNLMQIYFLQLSLAIYHLIIFFRILINNSKILRDLNCLMLIVVSGYQRILSALTWPWSYTWSRIFHQLISRIWMLMSKSHGMKKKKKNTEVPLTKSALLVLWSLLWWHF